MRTAFGMVSCRTGVWAGLSPLLGGHCIAVVGLYYIKYHLNHRKPQAEVICE